MTACEKARNLKQFEFRPGLHNVAKATAEDMCASNKTNTNLGLMDLLQKNAKVESTKQHEFKADRIILFGPDLYTARNIVTSLLINDGVPDAKARNVLLSNDYQYMGVAVRKHPSQDYVVCLAVCTQVYSDL